MQREFFQSKESPSTTFNPFRIAGGVSRFPPVFLLLLVFSILCLAATNAQAWPETTEWRPLLKSGGSIQDTGGGGKTGNNDASGSSNIVPDVNDPTDAPAAYIFSDGSYLYYRLRLDSSPAGTGGQGVLQQFGWGLEIDSNQNPDNYEWLIMVDGIDSPETVNLQKNTVQGTLGDPSDVAEITVASYPLPGNHRILVADTSINGDQDYFLDFRIPYQVFLDATGLDENSLIRYFAGTSKSANNLTDNGADLLGGSDLYNGLGDYLTPGGGTSPCGGYSDGTVRFVNALDGFTDVQLFTPGNTLYVRVDDADQTLESNPFQTVRVSLTTPAGDVEVINLTATGVAGKFSGQLLTRQGAVATRSNTLDLPAGSVTVTVSYLDAITASCTQSISRSDTIVSTTTQTDLHLQKSVSNVAPNPGGAINYTVTVTNFGPLVANAFTVTDAQPANVTFGAVTPPAPTTYAFAAGVATWSIPSLAVGAAYTLTLPATVGPGAAGTINNTAQLNYANDGYAPNNTAITGFYVTGTDLRVTKGVSNPTPAIGEQITYQVRVFNLGPNPVNNIVLNDVLPTVAPTAYVTYVSSTPSQGNYTDTLVPLNGVPDTWNVGSLAVGAGASLDIRVTVNNGIAGTTVTNTATLNPAGLNHPDYNPVNNSASVTFLAGAVDLEVTKSADNYGPAQNGTVTFSVLVKNLGPNTATGVVVRDILPAGLTYQSSTVSQGGFTDTLTPLNSVPETWTIGTLDKDASATLTVTALVTAVAGTTIHNNASLLALDQHDTDSANNIEDAVLQVGGTDLRVTKLSRKTTAPATAFADYTLVSPSNRVEFQVVVTNFGPANATNVALTDILPSGTSFVSYTATQGSYDGAGNGSKVWTVGAVNVNASATLTLTADVAGGATGTITNVAMLTASDQQDTDETNNIADAKLIVNGTDLGITKTVDNATPLVNSNITYTVTVTNYGPASATNVVVTDLLPPELTFVSSSLPAAYNNVTGVWTVGTVSYTGNPANDIATLTITAKVKNADNNLQIENLARITAVTQSDQNSANDSALCINLGAGHRCRTDQDGLESRAI